MRSYMILLATLSILITSCSQKNSPTTPADSPKTGVKAATTSPDENEPSAKSPDSTKPKDTKTKIHKNPSISGQSVSDESQGSKPSVKPANLTEGMLKFSLDILRFTGGKELKNNVLLSPYSIAAAFSMLYGGAKSNTASQIARVMGFGPNPTHHEQFHALEKALIPSAGGPTLELAYGIWVMNGFSLQPAYEKLISAHYSAALGTLDFSRRVMAARRINSWVENKTHKMISDLVLPSALGALTRLVLVNALYFKGVWKTRFDRLKTSVKPFTSVNGQTIRVNMMHRTGTMPFYKGNIGGKPGTEYRVVRLAYEGYGWSMVVMLPDSRDPAALIKILDGLTIRDIQTWIGHLDRAKVALGLPRFSISGTYSLSKVLASMGMPEVFTEHADLSGLITGREQLYVSAVFHKTRMDVDEAGTKAAAATAVIVKTRAMIRPVKPIPFICDHPFMVLLVHEPTQTVLFTGIVTKPDKSKGLR